MKKIMCIMLMFCFCLVGFTVGRRSVDVYLAANEAIYISRYDNNAYVWIYTYNYDTRTWDMKRALEYQRSLTSINVHFVDPIVY